VSGASLAARPSAEPARAHAAEPIVRLRGLTKRFAVRRGWREMVRSPRATRWTTALNAVTLDVRRGELFGVLGPNGAGKSTLFRLLSTLVLPDEGSARVDGLDLVRDAAAVRRTLAPAGCDERSLMWRLSAAENLRLYGALHGIRGDALHRRIGELLEVVELEDAGARMVGEYSSGMRQRLLIARALLPTPRVLLLDEPTRSLDPLSAQRFRAFLRERLVDGLGCTVLLATHSADEALGLCHRVGVLHRGRLRTVDEPARLARLAGGDRWRVWTRTPAQCLAAAHRMHDRVHGATAGAAGEDGWTPVEMEIPGGAEGACDVVAWLVREGIPVARVEPVRATLAGMLEHVLGASDA
jgi:ABC-2 type transport system ATP-binding protein